VVKELVVGVDGSTTSWRALSMALGIASRDAARVHVCLVLEPRSTPEIATFHTPFPIVADEYDGADLGNEVRKQMAQSGVEGEFSCRRGSVAPELEALAATYGADVIVVGRSRHPALHLGGVPRKLLAVGSRPVLVVP